jgi:hypothetical protein
MSLVTDWEMDIHRNYSIYVACVDCNLDTLDMIQERHTHTVKSRTDECVKTGAETND